MPNLARLPVTGSDANTWSDILNRNISQTHSPLNGAFNSFNVFSARPTNLTADDEGKSYIYTQTGNIHEWTGTNWKVYDTNNQKNVKDYGAIGDGAIDDVIAIQKTITNANGSMPVFIPQGVFMLSKGFLLPNNSIIDGAGDNLTILKMLPNLPARTNQIDQTAVFNNYDGWDLQKNTSCIGLKIKNLTIDLNYQNNPNLPMLNAIGFRGGSNCTIERVTCILTGLLSSASGISGIIFPNTSGTSMRVDNNIIRDVKVFLTKEWYTSPGIVNQNSHVGITLSGDLGPNNNGFNNFLTISGNTDYVTSRASNNLIENCSVDGGSHGILVINFSNSVIKNCNLSGQAHRGIYLNSGFDNKVINNNCYDIGSCGIHLVSGLYNTVVDGNSVSKTRNTNGECDGIKAYVGCRGLIITNNLVYDCFRVQIKIGHNVNDCIISNNRIYCTQKTSDNIGIEVKSNLSPQYGAGLTLGNLATSSRNIVSNNYISNVNYGIVLADDQNFANSISNNSVSTNTINTCNFGIWNLKQVGYTASGNTNVNVMKDNSIIMNKFIGCTNTLSPDYSTTNNTYLLGNITS